MDLSALRTLEYAIETWMPEQCKARQNVTMPGQDSGTPQQQHPPLAPMQVPIGANGLILLRNRRPCLLPRHCDVYSRALHCSDIHV